MSQKRETSQSLVRDLERLLQEGRRIAGSETSEGSLAWCRRAIQLAADVRSLPSDAKGRADALIEEAAVLVEASPRIFQAGEAEAFAAMKDRDPDEGPYADLLVALAGTSALAELDEDETPLPPFDHEAVWERLSPEERREAEEAARAASEWRAEVISLRARAKAAAAERLRLAAEVPHPPAEEDHVLLRRLPGGELLLSRFEGALYLDWYGEGAPDAHVGDEALTPGPLPGQAQGRRWRLPLQDGPLPLELRLGSERLFFDLP